MGTQEKMVATFNHIFEPCQIQLIETIFSTKGNVNPILVKPGWIEPDGKYNTFYYDTYTYNPNATTNQNANNKSPPYKYKTGHILKMNMENIHVT